MSSRLSALHFTLILVLLSCCLFFSGNAARAQGVRTFLHGFNDGTVPNDGLAPDALIQGADGNFYGTTLNGGATLTSGSPAHATGFGLNGYGTVYKMTSTGTVTILHSFGDGTVANDGRYPVALIQAVDGNFYGVTEGGGSTVSSTNLYGFGTIFKMTPSGVVTVLHSFGDGSVANDGLGPGALLQGSDGSLYGTTLGGGTTSTSSSPNGFGTVFKVTLTGTLSILHRFGDGTVTNDGTKPNVLVQGNDGSFYGTTEEGGSTVSADPNQVGYGTAFKLTSAGTVTILHSFGDTTVADDGRSPATLVQARDGNLYGTTLDGGNTSPNTSDLFGGGTAFTMTLSGTVTILHSFGNATPVNDGFLPNVLFQSSDGNFYGTTSIGGAAYVPGGNNGGGTIYKMTPQGIVTTLYSFGTAAETPHSEDPTALLQTSDGSFYGTTDAGGLGSGGTAFKFMETGPAAPTWSAVDVTSASDGTSRILWTRSNGAAGLWTMNAADDQTAVDNIYGPFTDWTARAVCMSATTPDFLWTRSDGAMTLMFDTTVTPNVPVGPVYGPYADFQGSWTATSIAATPLINAADEDSRLLWTRSDGAAGLWTMNGNNQQTVVGLVYGPYPGWTAKAVGVPGDGTSRVLWTRSDGAAGLWSFGPNDVMTTVGPAYGPYSDSHGTWTATGLGVSGDGSSQILWTRSDGAAGVWTLSAVGGRTIVGPVYGPFPGWTAMAISSSGDQARVLWTRTDRAAGLWSFVTNDAAATVGSVYGPY